ncbi:uncharacterized protein [Drosophila takahashii]|uniref:uncharacterized protein isoform X2 n=1 Tax=Drosophila takahashii TaxID=29030 RepID=UPI00389948D0
MTNLILLQETLKPACYKLDSVVDDPALPICSSCPFSTVDIFPGNPYTAAAWVVRYSGLSNSMVSKSNTSMASTSGIRDNMSATTLSFPFRCSIWKSYACNANDHRANRPFRSFSVMSH